MLSRWVFTPSGDGFTIMVCVSQTFDAKIRNLCLKIVRKFQKYRVPFSVVDRPIRIRLPILIQIQIRILPSFTHLGKSEKKCRLLITAVPVYIVVPFFFDHRQRCHNFQYFGQYRVPEKEYLSL